MQEQRKSLVEIVVTICDLADQELRMLHKRVKARFDANTAELATENAKAFLAMKSPTAMEILKCMKLHADYEQLEPNPSGKGDFLHSEEVTDMLSAMLAGLSSEITFLRDYANENLKLTPLKKAPDWCITLRGVFPDDPEQLPPVGAIVEAVLTAGKTIRKLLLNTSTPPLPKEWSSGIVNIP